MRLAHTDVILVEMEKQNKNILPLISAVTFLGFLDTHLLLPVLSLYASGLGATTAIAGLVIGLYSITNTPANILFGRLMDRVGYKVPLVIGLIGDALSMFLYSLCRLPLHLALVRVFHGTSGGMVGPATMSIVAESSAKMEKARAMSFYGMSLAATTLVGYGASGVIVSRLGYKALFLMGVALSAIGVMLSFLLPGSKKNPEATTKTSVGGFREIKALMQRRGLLVSYCSIFAQYFAFGGVVTLLPLYVKSLGMEALHVGMLMAAFAVAFIVVQFPCGTISDKVGRLTPTIAGLSLGAVSVAILPLLATFPLLALAMGLYGVAYGLLFPSISALLTDQTAPEERGIATGLFHALLTAGVAIGAPIMGGVGGAIGIEPGLGLSSVIMALPLLVALSALKRI